VTVDPSLVPESLRKTRIAGFSPSNHVLIPACFCVKDDICINHTEAEPRIETMLDLIESQMETLLLDEMAMVDNLQMIQKTSDNLMTSRKDTFKDILMGEYRSRQDDINSLESKVAHMSLQEHQHEKLA